MMNGVGVLLQALVVVVAVFGLPTGLYLMAVAIKYRNEQRSPEAVIDLDPEHRKRLEPYSPAIEFQLVTNAAHNAAIDAKKRYHALGVAASAGGPGIILLNVFGGRLVASGLLDANAQALAETLIIATILAAIFGHSHPSNSYCRARLASEILRVHLHAFLAGVGPYENGSCSSSVPGALAEQLLKRPNRKLRDDLVKLEEQCNAQFRSGLNVVAPGLHFGPHRLVAYEVERIHEQDGWFAAQILKQERYYRWSTTVLGASIVVGLIASAVLSYDKLWLQGAGGVQEPLHAFLAGCSALGVFVLGVRAVFGWDQKGELYSKQYERIEVCNSEVRLAARKLRELLGDALDPSTLPTPAQLVEAQEAMQRLRLNAAGFEGWMSREACDFGFITDRRFFDIAM
jgi:hypothetical protein